MFELTPQTLFMLQVLLFGTVVGMHLAKKNPTVIVLYALQSFIVAGVLGFAALHGSSALLFVVAFLTLVIKVITAPRFFLALVRKHEAPLSLTAYANVPATLGVLALLTAFAFSGHLEPLTHIAPEHAQTIALGISMAFIAIFLVVNRKGVLSQIVGVLSLENAIVYLGSVAGLETMVGPQIGILFTLLVWVAIARAFAEMIYRHFGALDTNALTALKEE